MNVDLTGHEVDVLLFDLPKLLGYYESLDDSPMTMAHLADLKRIALKLRKAARY